MSLLNLIPQGFSAKSFAKTIVFKFRKFVYSSNIISLYWWGIVVSKLPI